jgi:hypothetical protein
MIKKKSDLNQKLDWIRNKLNATHIPPSSFAQCQISVRLWGPLTTRHFQRCGMEPVTLGCFTPEATSLEWKSQCFENPSLLLHKAC